MRDLLLRTPLLVTLCMLAGAAMLLPALHASVLNEDRVARGFFYSGIIVMILSLMVQISTQNRRPRNVARSLLGSLVASYVILPLIFALPIVQAVPDTSFGNAWFEMVSCFTTTGATVYEDPSRLSQAIHFWRALVGWLGGIYILVTASAILAPMNLGGIEVMSGRVPGRNTSGLSQITQVAEPSERFLRYTVLLFPIYTGLTMLLWLALMILGERNLVALVHAMGTLSTSGISMSGDLDVLTSGIPGEVMIFVFLLVALSRRFLPGGVAGMSAKPLYQDPEIRLASVVFAMVTLILFLRHWIGSISVESAETPSLDWLRALWGGAFTAISFLTTTGYESGEWVEAQYWSGLTSPGLILAGLAILGGGVATTAGGVKLLRVYALYRHGERELERLIHPSSVGGAGTEARRIRREGAYSAWLFFMLFALSIAVCVALIALFGVDFESALVLTLSALTTTGQLADLAASQPVTYSSLSFEVKTILGVTMVVGRLETLAILAVLTPAAWQR